MNTKESDASYQRKAFLFIAIAFIFRVLYSVFYEVHLVGDEAYYWDWGRRPAAGYFSKPPFIAWLYGVVNFLGNGSLFSIRFTAVLLGTLSLFATFFLTKKLFDVRTAFVAVVLALAVPGNCLLSFLLTIDAPLVLCWTLALYFLWKYSQGEQPGQSLLLLFICLGIGHLSKQMMLFFPPLAIAFLATGRETRPLLKRPGLWLSLAGSMITLALPLYWNSKNGWITFNHMSTHIGGQKEETILATLYERFETCLEFIGSQLGALSPVTAVLIFTLTVVGLFKYKNPPANHRYLTIFCGIPMIFILIVSMLQKVQPNWPAVLYLAGIPMVAAWFTRLVDWFPAKDKTRDRLFKGAIIPGFLLCAFFYFSPILFSVFGAEGHKANPNRRLIGSSRYAAAVQQVREKVPNWQEAFIATTGHRYDSSWLAFELPDQPRAYNLLRGQIDSQYKVWPGPWEDGFQGKDGIIVHPGHNTGPPPGLLEAFEKVEKLDEITVQFGGGVGRYTIFHGIKMKAPVPL